LLESLVDSFDIKKKKKKKKRRRRRRRREVPTASSFSKSIPSGFGTSSRVKVVDVLKQH